jgi:tetraacyldisaccharide 4'-kinase
MSLERAWYQPAAWLTLLRPLSLLFGYLAKRRRMRLSAEAKGPRKPILIIGNIAVGGSGKTPLILALAEIAKSRGIKVGVISRGYGGQSKHYPLAVSPSCSADQVGDEPLLIARRAGVPVVVDPDRVSAANYLAENFPVDLILSDDGLQHYALKRSAEWIVVDAMRGLGNQKLLPEGPLREPVSRLNEAALVLLNGEGVFDYPGAIRFNLVPEQLVSLNTGDALPASFEVLGSSRVNAVAGIGDPNRFFNTLERLGFSLNRYPLKDHQKIDSGLLAQISNDPIIMTEKDAVKCGSEMPTNCWYLSVTAQFDAASATLLADTLLDLINDFGEQHGS